jgi:histidinol-phosphate aminotransferase
MTGPGAENPFPSTEMVQRRTGLRAWARLSTNENEFGPAAEVIAAIAAAAGAANRYPDCDHFELRQALGARLGVDPELVHVGSGIDGLLGALCRAFLGPGTTAVTTAGTYPTFAYFAGSVGATVEPVAYRDLRCDPAALADRARVCAAAVVYLVEPDNPTGSSVGGQRAHWLLDNLPEQTLLVIDGAYAEYQDPARRLVASSLLERPALWLRTFSKAYGLAGMRVGYAVGQPELLRRMRRGAEHYVVGRLAEGSALAAVKASAHVEQVVQETARGRAHYAERLTELGFSVLPSETNFVTFRCPQAAGSIPPESLERELAQAGVFVRRLAAPGVEGLLRMTVGPVRQREAVVGLLTDLLASRGSATART